MGDAYRLGDPAGVMDILPCTAGALSMRRSAMIVKLQGNPKHIIPFPLKEGSNHGGIDPSRHGNDNARFGWVAGKTERIEHHTIPEAPFKAAHGKQRDFYTRCCVQTPEPQTTPSNAFLTIMAKSRQMRNLGCALRKTLSRAM
jgi:hypothetical protein